MKRGFTLIELLIVLTILSVLTLVAVQSLGPLAEQASYESTRTTLDRIEEAVMGPESLRQTDGTPIISGFVADVGRLPMMVDGSPPGWELQELWNDEFATTFPYGTRPGPVLFADENFSHIRLACGWRGPYLRPPSTAGLRDGWGKPLAYLFSGDPLTLEVAADLTAEMPSVAEPPRMMSLVTLVGRIVYDDGTPAVGNGNVSVNAFLISPDAGIPDSLSVTQFAVTEEAPDFVFSSVAPGLRAIRVVVRQDGNEFADKTVYRHVLRSGISDLQIELGTPPPVAPPVTPPEENDD
ncbi:MAG: prepilin-type N-terminal cleavage/methylation domain-containing protein [Planctomycetaceae bacterium]|nr:MAG: prepilin-type N-terminal cleavage/methylation domain-containing protein [Planctomycetaceae bacterium]